MKWEELAKQKIEELKLPDDTTYVLRGDLVKGFIIRLTVDIEVDISFDDEWENHDAKLKPYVWKRDEIRKDNPYENPRDSNVPIYDANKAPISTIPLSFVDMDLPFETIRHFRSCQLFTPKEVVENLKPIEDMYPFIYVVGSHEHEEIFNQKLLEWTEKRGEIKWKTK